MTSTPRLIDPDTAVAIGGNVTGGTTGSVLFVGSGGVLAQDNSNFFWDDTNNQLLLGNGTAGNPSYSFGSDPDSGFFWEASNRIALSLGGSTRFFFDTSSVQAPSGSLSSPSYRFAADGNLGMYRQAEDILGFVTGGSERVTINASGNVGIGQTTPTSKLDIVAGTLANDIKALSLTATMGSVPTSSYNFADATFTTAGSAGQIIRGFQVTLAAGYTGASPTRGFNSINSVAGTANDLLLGTPGSGIQGNVGHIASVQPTTVGANAGMQGIAGNGNVNIGMSGVANIAKNSATNIGVLGVGLNTGTTPIQIGGYFSLNAANPTFTSAALMCDNGSTTSDIFVARDNGTAVWTIADGGNFAPNTDNAVTFGTSALRPSTIFTNSLALGAGSTLYWSGRSEIKSPADGVISFNDTGSTGAMILKIGGTTSSFPAIKRNATALNFRLADDSADAPITAATATLSGTLIGTPDTRTGAGAVSVATLTTKIVTGGVADALTLADGTAGQIKTIVLDVVTTGGDTAVLTPATKTGFTTVTFAAAGNTVTLQFFATRGWMVIASFGAVVA